MTSLVNTGIASEKAGIVKTGTTGEALRNETAEPHVGDMSLSGYFWEKNRRARNSNYRARRVRVRAMSWWGMPASR